MKLYYFRDPKGNFGDDLNMWLWGELAPDRWSEMSGTYFCGIGTLVSASMPAAAKRWVVFSSGAGYGPPPPGFGGQRWTVPCVRGPLTAKVLKLEPSCAVTDGAALISTLPQYAPLPESERSGVVFMPHHYALEDGALEEACRRAGVEFISPREESRKTLNRLRRAKLVLADAMHAAIVADTVRVPWVPLQSSPQINTFKWLDWTLSLDMPYEATRLPPSSVTEQAKALTLGLYGNRYALPEATFEKALDHYRRDARMKSHRWWTTRRNFGRAVHTRLARPLLSAGALSKWRAARDETYIDRAAETLRVAAASGRSYLSDDALLRSKQDELLSRLHALPRD